MIQFTHKRLKSFSLGFECKHRELIVGFLVWGFMWKRYKKGEYWICPCCDNLDLGTTIDGNRYCIECDYCEHTRVHEGRCVMCDKEIT